MDEKKPKYLIEYESQGGDGFRLDCNSIITILLILLMLAASCYLIVR